jgi:hypothetical protein
MKTVKSLDIFEISVAGGSLILIFSEKTRTRVSLILIFKNEPELSVI